MPTAVQVGGFLWIPFQAQLEVTFNSDDEVEPGPDVTLKLAASTKVPGTKTPTITKLTSPGTTAGACVSSLSQLSAGEWFGTLPGELVMEWNQDSPQAIFESPMVVKLHPKSDSQCIFSGFYQKYGSHHQRYC